MLDVSIKKLDIVNEKNNVGMANGVDMLQAQTDVNTAEQNMKVQQLIIDEDKADLLLLINSKTNAPFLIDDSIDIDKTLVLDSIIACLNRNPNLQAAEQQVKIDQQLLKEAKSQFYPSLQLNANYDFARTDNKLASTLLNQNFGPSAGLTLQVPIFNGNVYRTKKIVAGLNLANSKLEQESLYCTINTTAFKKYLSYTTTLKQVESQRQNFQLSKNLVDLVLQNFQYGQATILDVKAAQSSYENAAYLLINFLYTAKVSEIELKQLIYRLTY